MSSESDSDYEIRKKNSKNRARVAQKSVPALQRGAEQDRRMSALQHSQLLVRSCITKAALSCAARTCITSVLAYAKP